ncbi:MAG: SidA/IucD/PvdA family monooxygenase [Ferruginibacter sp.]|nr:SidA/IucD/PvdA family monooxygenase [Ferruginibacter sp.]
MNKQTETDLVGIGIGPSNLSTAALLHPVKDISSIFFDCKKEFQWFPGMLFPEATIQVSWLKDLVTLVDPTSRYSFLAFLAHKKRMYRFSMARFPRVKRREFNQYFQWVSGSLPNLHFDISVDSVSFDDDHFTLQHSKGESRSKNIVIAAGQSAKVPDCVRPHLCSTVFHATQFIKENNPFADKRIIVVGGGQSGAELVNQLLLNRSALPMNIRWISRRPNFLPIDDSPFTNEFFTPSYSEYFYHLPDEEKRKLLGQQTLASDGINLDLLEDIYRNLYEVDLIEGKGKLAKLHFNHDVLDFKKENNGWALICKNTSTGETNQYDADIVIFATGFEYQPPKFLEPIMGKLKTTPNGFEINEDFCIQWDGPKENKIFIQNGARHVRGVADPNLSLVAWRSAKIINSLAGKKVYDIENESSVFNWQQFVPNGDDIKETITEGFNEYMVKD